MSNRPWLLSSYRVQVLVRLALVLIIILLVPRSYCLKVANLKQAAASRRVVPQGATQPQTKSTKPKANALPVQENTLYAFNATPKDADVPMGPVIQASDGNFYGVANAGGADGAGAIYQVTPAGVEKVVYSFTGGADGKNPVGAPLQASDGNIYGATSQGGTGPGQGGTIYQYSLATGVFTTIYEFQDYGYALGELIDDGNGNLYGTAEYGGTLSVYSGTIFSYNYTSNTYTGLYAFSSSGSQDGMMPYGGLVLASDGNLYGTTAAGGKYGYGTAYKIAKDGTGFNAFYAFSNGADGVNSGQAPTADLVEFSDGNLYGTSSTGTGLSNGGVFFKIIPDPTSPSLTGIFKIGDADGASNVIGGRPFIGGDANFYISANQGGILGGGQTIQLTSAGVYADVFDFAECAGGPTTGCQADAAFESTDGNLYVPTELYGANGNGTFDQLVTGLPAAISLVPSSSSVPAGSSVTLTWAVNNAYGLNAQVCIARSSDNSWTGSVGISGSASITPTGTGTVTYAYTCGGIETATVAVSVTAAPLVSATILTASPNPAIIGQSVMLTATVSGSGPTPTGNIKFVYGSKLLGISGLSGGVASYSSATAGLAAGTYNVVAQYVGDSTYAGSNSAALPVVLNRPAAASVVFSATPNPVIRGQQVMLSATVTSNSGLGTPAGSVYFYTGSTYLGSATISSGVATLTANTQAYPLGAYPVSATFAGDANNSGATSALSTVTLEKATTLTTLSADPGTVTRPASVTLTAATTRSGSSGTPTGSVAFFFGTDYLGSATLDSSGVAVLTHSSNGVTSGSYGITAQYNGDSDDSSSTSSSVTVTVN